MILRWNWIQTCLLIVGVVTVLWVLFKLVRSLWRAAFRTILAHLLGYTVRWGDLGRWAVVTGATDGLGKAYALQLAAKGFDIVLVSRTQPKLQKVAAEIESRYHVRTKTIVVDMTSGTEIYDLLREEIQDLDVGVLVNNVGVCYKHMECLTNLHDGEKLADDIIKLNIVSVVRMTQLILPIMEKKRRGVILNISSISALLPLPGLSMYGASKAYVHNFTLATQDEYRSKGIIIQSVLPSYLSTNMFKVKPNLLACTADVYVRWSLRSVGVEDSTYAYPVHRLQGYLIEVMRDYMPNGIVRIMKKYYFDVLLKNFYSLFKID